MASQTRDQIVTEAQLHARSISTTGAPQTTDDWVNLVCEIYQWVDRFVTPSRWSYLSLGVFTINGVTTIADSGLTFTNGVFRVTTQSRKIVAISDAWWSSTGVGGLDPGSGDAGNWLIPVEPDELLQIRRYAPSGSGIAPRYVAWRAVGTDASDGSAMGKWEILIAPTNLTATADIVLTLRCLLGLSNPDTDTRSTSGVPILGASTVADVMPHECRLISRLAAYEMLLRNGTDPDEAQLVVRHVQPALLKSFRAARKLQRREAA